MNEDKDKDLNRDPITGEPGSHPVGTGLGAAGGGAAGAAAGAVGGPVGAAVGGIVGAVVGGLAGKGVAEAIDPTAEDQYWRENYRHEDYIDSDLDYDHYELAYRTGYTGAGKYPGRKFDEVESDLERDYEHARGESKLEWAKARHASRAAWHRVERALPGDADGDGR